MWKVTLFYFGFTLLRKVISLELKLAPYFKLVRLKIKPIAILVTCVFSRVGQITWFLLHLLIMLLNLILLWVWFYNTQLKCPLNENPVHWAYLPNSTSVKSLNCSSSSFWFNTILFSSQKILFIKWLPVFPLIADTSSSACGKTSAFPMLLSQIRNNTYRLSSHLRWGLKS